MPKFEFVKRELRRIERGEVEDWLRTLRLPPGAEIKIGGGIYAVGFSYRDVDLELYPAEGQECKDIIKGFPSAPWPVDLLCKRCGAIIHYQPANDTYLWTWDNRTAEFVREWPPQRRGISARMIFDLEKRIKTLESKLEGME